MSKSHLDKQIEKIVDEAVGDSVGVIVQMETSGDLGEYLEATTAAIERRRSVASARALLPPPHSKLKTNAKGRITAASRRKLRGVDTISAGPFLASQTIQAMAEAALKAVSTKALEPLLQSDWVKGVVAAHELPELKGKRDTHRRPRPVHFWTSGSAVLTMSRAQLEDLPNQLALPQNLWVGVAKANRP